MPGVNYPHKGTAPRSRGIYRSIANQIGWVVIAIGVLVLLSWVFDIEAGKRVLPIFQSMKFNTALCFIACGFILRRKARATASASDPVAALLALFVLVVSGLTLLEYGSGWQLGIDNLVILDTATSPEDWPGRMSAATALCFSMIGAAWLASMIPLRHSTLILQLLALVVTMISGAALIGYVFGVHQFRLPVFSTMALHTAALFVLCGAGMLFVRPGDGLMGSATSPYIGGRSLRRLLPFIVATPLLMGWLSMQGVVAGYYAEAFGFALSSLSSILVLGFVGWLGADALNCEEERFRSTIDSSPVATIMVDENGIIRMANQLAHSVFRCPERRLVGLPVEHLIPDQFRQGHKGYRREYMHHPKQRIMGEGREPFSFDQPEIQMLLQEVAGDISFAIANLEKSQQLEYLTHFDSITDLPNRLLMTDRLQQAMFQADSHQGIVSILYLDIDRFKQVNDRLGHNGGDDVIRQVSQRISSCVGKADTVSRWGGDEFIVLLPGQYAADASGIANTITVALHSPIVLDDSRELFVSCSIGIAEYPFNGGDIDALINSATSAMTAIKEQGGNDYRHFVPRSDRASDDRLALETSLRHALAQDQFELNYQPQIYIASRNVVGLEALLRWHHPTMGMVAPDRFIPHGRKDRTDRAHRRMGATRSLPSRRRPAGTENGGVNLSARQFHQQNLVTVPPAKPRDSSTSKTSLPSSTRSWRTPVCRRPTWNWRSRKAS
jgi:diguanylate cyclase (GGDEF)-like protein